MMHVTASTSVLCIGGTDPLCAAGLAVDIKTASALQVPAQMLISAEVIQNHQQVKKINYPTPEAFQATLDILLNGVNKPLIIKMGLLPSLPNLKILRAYFENYFVTNASKLIVDPVISASNGDCLMNEEQMDYLKNHLMSHIDLLTPNILEVETLTQQNLKTESDIEVAAKKIIAMGAKAVLIKGGHALTDLAQDYFFDGVQSFWLSQKRYPKNIRGTGCCLATAIACFLARNETLADAMVFAKSYLSQAIRLSHCEKSSVLIHQAWPMHSGDLPWLTASAQQGQQRHLFLNCGDSDLGFYPIVDDVRWLKRLLPIGVKTIQLRIKNKSDDETRAQIVEGVTYAEKFKVRLFINDYWQWAIEFGAYGVHLGQEDIGAVDFSALAAAHIRVGISTHSATEVARAHAYRPSYIAYGPIYPTQTKKMCYTARGLDSLKNITLLAPYPVIAIGGIDLMRAAAIKNSGANGVAVISAIRDAENPEEAVNEWLK